MATLPSPLVKWGTSRAPVPVATPVGLKGVDPANGLRLVNFSDVNRQECAGFARMFCSDDGEMAILYFLAKVQLLPHEAWNPRERFVLVGCHALYVCYSNSNLRRCIPIEAIEELVTTGDQHALLKVPSQYNLAMHFSSPNEVAQLREVLTTLHQQLTGRQLRVTRAETLPQVSLAKPANWKTRHRPEVVKVRCVTQQQLEEVRLLQQQQLQSEACQTSEAPTPPVHPQQPPPPRSPAPSPPVEPSPSPVNPSRAKEMNDLKAQIAAMSAQLDQLEAENAMLASPPRPSRGSQGEKLRTVVEQQDDLIQDYIAADYAFTLDRRRIAEVLGLPFPPDVVAAGDPTKLVPFEPFAPKVSEKLEEWKRAKEETRAEVNRIQEECKALHEQQQRVWAEGEQLRWKVAEASTMKESGWEEHLGVASKMQELVDTTEALTFATKEIKTQLLTEKGKQQETVTRITAEHDARVAELEKKLSQQKQQLDEVQHRLSEREVESRKDDEAMQKGREELRELQDQIAAVEEEKKRLESECKALEEAKEQDAKMLAEGVLEEEIREACEQLQLVAHHISDLESHAAAAPALRDSLGKSDRQLQHLDFEIREILVKVRNMRRDYHSRLAEAKMKLETCELKLRAAEEVPRQQAEAMRKVEQAKAQLAEVAATVKRTIDKEKEQLLQQQQEFDKRLKDLDSFCEMQLRSLSGDSALGLMQEREEMQWKVNQLDDALRAVEGQLLELDNRERDMHQGYVANEEVMLNNRERLLQSIVAWEHQSACGAIHFEDACSLIRQARGDLEQIEMNILSVRTNMDCLSGQVRESREVLHKTEQHLLNKRDELLARLSEIEESIVAEVDDDSNKGSVAESVVVVTRKGPAEKWGLTCLGTTITAVVPASPADKAGLSKGDLFLRILPQGSDQWESVTSKEEVYALFCSSPSRVKAVVIKLGVLQLPPIG